MVGMMGTGGFREQAMALLNDAKLQEEIAAKTDLLGRAKEIVMFRDTSLLAEFLPYFMEFQADSASPVRSNLAQIIEEVGVKHLDYTALMVPVLKALIRDSIPAVVRRAVTAGSNLFRNIFEQVAMKGIYLGHVEKSLENSWICCVTIKDAIYEAANEHGNDGVRLLTIKFLETVILLFTPDPNRPAQSPSQQNWDGHGFNFSWIVGGHPILDAELLGREADEYLTYLLEQLSEQVFCKLSGPVAIVLVNSLAIIAKRRPAMYGLIIPALSRLGPVCEGIRGPQRASIIHAVKNGLVSLLRCTHAGAGIWRERLVTALKAMNAGDLAEAAIRQTDRMLRNAERERAFRDLRLSKEERSQPVDYKRPLQENGSVPSDLNASSAKRLRVTSGTALACSQGTQVAGEAQGVGAAQDSSGMTLDSNLTPLQQMIALIGALVAKGERAASSIELLISKLPEDMLADVVIENMKNLPATAPGLPSSTNASGTSDTQPNTTGSLRVEAAPTGSFGVPELSSPVQTASEHRRDPRRDPRRMDPRRVAVPVGVPQSSIGASVKVEEPAVESPRQISSPGPVPVINTATTPSQLQDVKEETIDTWTNDQQISSPHRDVDTSLGQEAISNPGHSLRDDVVVPPESIQTLQVESAVALAPNVLVLEFSSTPETGDQSLAVEPMDAAEAAPLEFVAPLHAEPATSGQTGSEGAPVASYTGMPGPTEVMPVIYLDQARQLALWKLLLLRLLERYIVSGTSGAGGSRFGLLSRLISQSTEDGEAITILQDFILADYQSHKGHELAMHMLYQLCAERMSGEGDTMASDVYDNFLIAVAQGLRDTLPPADKSLSRLLSEAPVIPHGALRLLESMCNPSGTDPVNGERIFQGLSAVWILILLRPPIRADCLEIALKCAVHELDEVRTKAIRLVANKLYPLKYVSQRIEEFAVSMLHNVVGGEHTEDSVKRLVGYEALPRKQPTKQVVSGGEDCSIKSAEKPATGGDPVEGNQPRGGKGHVSIAEAQQCMSLYFALCTKKVPLLRRLFEIYEHAPKAVRQAAHRNMPVLVRTIGSTSSDLLQLLSDPPAGSKNLLLLVLHLLTEADAPSPALIAIVKKLYESKIKDARILTPILSSLSKAEVLPLFPHLVALPSEDFKAALDRILQGSVHTGPALTPAEVLVAIHAIDPDRDHIPLAMVKDACAVCFQQRTVFTQQVLTKVLKQLVEQTPVPMLFMRTVILAVGSFRPLVSFVMEILSRLVTKQIWKWPNLWIGFLKCADQTQPHSFHVLLQLPAAQLDKALHKHPNLRSPLTAYANKPGLRSSLPRPTLAVLGLLQDVLPSDTTSFGQTVPDVASPNVLERQIRESTAKS